MKKQLWPILFTAILMSACMEAPEPFLLEGSGELEQSQLPIYNGSPPDAPEHAAVVGLHQLTKRGSVYVSPFCSGTLVTADIVVTAAHCLDVGTGGKPNFQTMAPSKLAIYVGDDPSVDILEHLYLVEETLIHPGYDRVMLLNDIALVRLVTPIAEAVVPVPHLPSEFGLNANDAGAIVDFAGFGQTETGSSGVKLHVELPFSGLGCVLAECPDGGDPATQVSYAQQTGGPCFGDSGGPMFISRDGLPYVSGITSYGDSECLYYGVSTRVDAYETWIEAFIAPPPPPDCSANGVCNSECPSGDDPDCEPEPPLGCGDGVCASDESCDGRSGTAACVADCPGKTKGKPSTRFCFVGDTCEGPACP